MLQRGLLDRTVHYGPGSHCSWLWSGRVYIKPTSGSTSTITAPSVTPTTAPSMAPNRPSIIINQPGCTEVLLPGVDTPTFLAHPRARTRPQSSTYLSARRRERIQRGADDVGGGPVGPVPCPDDHQGGERGHRWRSCHDVYTVLPLDSAPRA